MKNKTKTGSENWTAKDWTDALIRVIRVLIPVALTDKFIYMVERWNDGRPVAMIPEWIAYAESLGIRDSDAGNYVLSRAKHQFAREAH